MSKTKSLTLSEEMKKLDTFLNGLDEESLSAFAIYLFEKRTTCNPSNWVMGVLHHFLESKPKYKTFVNGLEFRVDLKVLEGKRAESVNEQTSSIVNQLMNFPKARILKDRSETPYRKGSVAYLRKKYKFQDRLYSDNLRDIEDFKGRTDNSLDSRLYTHRTTVTNPFWKDEEDKRVYFNTSTLKNYHYSEAMYADHRNAPVLILGIAKTEDTPYRHNIYHVARVADLSDEFYIYHRLLKSAC